MSKKDKEEHGYHSSGDHDHHPTNCSEIVQHAEDVAAETLLTEALQNSEMPWTSSERKVKETAKIMVMTLREAGMLRCQHLSGTERELILLRTKVEIRSRHLQWSIGIIVAFLAYFLFSLKGG